MSSGAPEQSNDPAATAIASLGQRIDDSQQQMLATFKLLREELDALTAQVAEYQADQPDAAEEQYEAEVVEASTDELAAEDGIVEIEEATPRQASQWLPNQPAADAASSQPPVAFPVEPVAAPVAQPVAQPVHITPPVQAVGSGDDKLEHIIFGEELASHDHLAGDRREVVNGLLAGDETAMALAGQMLIFRAADAETMPKLLIGLGEAYYAWRPQTVTMQDEFRNAIIQWLTRECEIIDSNHRIELVQIGDRFENRRHNSKVRGVEVTDVHGWVVVRENGSVYTKALVTVS